MTTAPLERFDPIGTEARTTCRMGAVAARTNEKRSFEFILRQDQLDKVAARYGNDIATAVFETNIVAKCEFMERGVATGVSVNFDWACLRGKCE
jgi:hypothetical protein